MQIVSVIVVTLGVVLTTLSAARPKSKTLDSHDLPPSTLPLHFTASYGMGIIILSVALIFAGLLGLVQDWTYSKYGRSLQPAKAHSSNGHASNANGSLEKINKTKNTANEVPAWQESMFYLHFLAMPMFLLVGNDLQRQFQAVHAGPKLSVPLSTSSLYDLNPWLSYPLVHKPTEDTLAHSTAIQIPIAYFPLLLNTFTQLLCASGVHRLTGKVSSLTVTLTLVVRKAVSLLISVLLYGDAAAKGNAIMWTGAALVLAGTIGYSMGGKSSSQKVVNEKQGEERVMLEP